MQLHTTNKQKRNPNWPLSLKQVCIADRNRQTDIFNDFHYYDNNEDGDEEGKPDLPLPKWQTQSTTDTLPNAFQRKKKSITFVKVRIVFIEDVMV